MNIRRITTRIRPLPRNHQLLQIPIANRPSPLLSTDCEQILVLQPQITLLLVRRQELQFTSFLNVRAVVLVCPMTQDAVRDCVQGPACEVEDWQAVIARCDEAQEVVLLVERVEQGGRIYVSEVGAIGCLFELRGCDEEEVGREFW